MCMCLSVGVYVCVCLTIHGIDAVSESMLFEVPVEYTASPYFLIFFAQPMRYFDGAPRQDRLRVGFGLTCASAAETSGVARHNRWCHALGTAKKALFQQRDRACSHKLET